MKRSTPSPGLQALLTQLSAKARALSLTDTEWSSRAGVRKETLSRLRRRSSCDLSTLQALAAVVGARVVLDEGAAGATTLDGHFPASLDREYEARLLRLAASGSLASDTWTVAGPRFFMAGFAVMLAGERELDRIGLLALAEHLRPGASEPVVFTHWLERSPLRPSRFLPLLAMERRPTP